LYFSINEFDRAAMPARPDLFGEFPPMTSRERWTVYPLLFLTMGISLKDKVAKLVNVDHVICKTLEVTDSQGKPRVVIGSNLAGGIVKADSSTGPGVAIGSVPGPDRIGLLFFDRRGVPVPGLGMQVPLQQKAPPVEQVPRGQEAPNPDKKPPETPKDTPE
jgi:hypothetical protein